MPHPISPKGILQHHRPLLCCCPSIDFWRHEHVARPVSCRDPMLQAVQFTQSVCVSPYAVFFPLAGPNRQTKVWAGLQTTCALPAITHQFILFAQTSGNLPMAWQQPNKTRPVTQAGRASSVSQRSGLMAGRRIIPALAVSRCRMFVLPSHIYDSKQNRKRRLQRLRVIYCSTFQTNH